MEFSEKKSFEINWPLVWVVTQIVCICKFATAIWEHKTFKICLQFLTLHIYDQCNFTQKSSTDNINLKPDGVFFCKIYGHSFWHRLFLGDMQKLKRISLVCCCYCCQQATTEHCQTEELVCKKGLSCGAYVVYYAGKFYCFVHPNMIASLVLKSQQQPPIHNI